MSRRAVDSVFQAMFILTDLRVMLRSTAPSHNLDPAQKEEADRLIRTLEQQISAIREEMLG